MNKIFVLLILSSMVTIGHLTTCKRCWTLDSTECCSEKEIQCDGSKCMMLSEYCNVSNEIYNSVRKMCAVEALCNTCFSASTNHDFYLRVSAECGEGDNSNADLKFKELCNDQLPLNGYMCPSCYVNTSTDGCESEGMVLCRGNEFECLKFRSSVQLSDGSITPMSVQGCITQGGCQIGFGGIPGAKQYDPKEMTCTPATRVNPDGKN
ncbi:uncharacterized protein LOC120916422 [Rana temporaria]|uniref:uncharacterized protein LOC120916422 n=1 Tax=Rana temporaria TaxID=8407 RepID=UPI001AAD9C04|nr:uncharacterized protein LOC120916422 [Rana temporaria]